MRRRLSALSRDLRSPGARQWILAADILERYVSVGYVPDVVDCITGIRSVLPIGYLMKRVELLSERARPIEQLIQGRPAVRKVHHGLKPEDDADKQQVASDPGNQNGSRPERASLIVAMGEEFLLVPLARLYQLVQENTGEYRSARQHGLFDDNAYTEARATSWIAYRWYVKGDREVEARFMARRLYLNARIVLDVLEHLNISGDRIRRRARLGGDDGWLHFEGVIGASDLRVTGGSKAVVEVSIRSESRQHGLELLSNVVVAIGVALGVGDRLEPVQAVVSRRLRLEELQ
jgi:hypothetical protein